MNGMLEQIAPNITTMIRMDHTHVMAVFHRYKVNTSPGKKQALVRHAVLALEVHTQLEEEIFYPALRRVLSGDDVLDKSEPDHEQMKRLMTQIEQQSPEDATYDDNFLALMRIVMHHVADEETRLLPAAERLLTGELAQLGAEMTRRRAQLMRPHAGEIASTAVRSFPAGAATLAVGALALGAMLFAKSKSKPGTRRYWQR